MSFAWLVFFQTCLELNAETCRTLTHQVTLDGDTTAVHAAPTTLIYSRSNVWSDRMMELHGLWNNGGDFTVGFNHSKLALIINGCAVLTYKEQIFAKGSSHGKRKEWKFSRGRSNIWSFRQIINGVSSTQGSVPLKCYCCSGSLKESRSCELAECEAFSFHCVPAKLC